MKRIPSAVIGALALTLAGASFAAGTTGGMSSGSSPSASTQAPDLSSSFKSTDLIGLNVANKNKDNLGSISNLIVDKEGKVSHVVLSEAAGETAGGNEYIIPWARVQLTPGQEMAMVDVDPTTLSSEFAAFDDSMTAPVSSAPGGSSSGATPPPAGPSGY